MFASTRVLGPRALPAAPGSFSAAGGSVAAGRHIAASYGGCLGCHGANLAGGRRFMNSGAMGTLAAPNLTRGAGGVGSAYTDADFERALRAGMLPDGTGLLVMPSVAFTHMSDADVRDVIAYVRSVPAVDDATPPRTLGPVARALIAFHKLPVESDLIDLQAAHNAVTPIGVTVDHGRYLARVGGCMDCHGANLAGGHYKGSPSDPAGTNITPAAIGMWSQGDFARTLRTGRDPSGHVLDRFMPWTSLGQLDDDELAALWTYLRSVPAVKVPP